MNDKKESYEIEFCTSCYLQHAIELIERILSVHVHDKEFVLVLKPGASGSFFVRKNGNTIYSKNETGRLPTYGDLGINGQRDGASSVADGNRCEKC
jgi:selT/selW/selH-like putative selenoprotein